jgi:WD40 repeat protein
MPLADDPAREPPGGSVVPDGADDPAAVPARLDAFISYRRIRADTEFVDHLSQALTGRGKQVWVDRAKIEPAADWSQRIALGIGNAKALIFVISPESVESRECLHELDSAVQLHKLIIPVVLREVSRDRRLPEGLTRPNWILFTPGQDADQALSDVITALEEDLGWRDAHTRLTVRAKEWTDTGRDRSFLLRGSDLSRAEDWVSQASHHSKTPPTALQTEYIVASRKASVRAQRTWRGALSAGLVVALVLAAVAFVQRNSAQAEARLAQSRAKAAEAISDLSSDPEQGLRLALQATKINPNGPSEQALRLAMAQDRLRMVIRSGVGSAALASWNPAQAQIAVTAPHDSVALWNTGTGRLSQVMPATPGHAVNQLLYSPDGSRLAAVSSAGYVAIWDISARGTASPVAAGHLDAVIQADDLYRGSGGPGGEFADGAWAGPHGSEFDIYGAGLSNVLIFEPGSGHMVSLFRQPFTDAGANALAPSPNASELLVGGDLIDFTSHRQISLSPGPPIPPGPYCWFAGGSAVVTSTSVSAGGPVRIYRARDGVLSAHMQTPDGPTSAVACSANPANQWVAAGDAGGNVILRLATGTVVPLYGHSDVISAIASSPDGRYLATASIDGTARVWDASSGHAVTVLAGDGAALNDVQFGPGDGLALTVDQRGFVRVWDTGLGEPVTELSPAGHGQSIVTGFTASGTQVSGMNLTTSTGTAATVTSASVVTWDARSGRLIRRVGLPGIVPSTAPCSAKIQPATSTAGLNMMTPNGGCNLPPPSSLLLAVTVPRPLDAFSAEENAVVELLAVAVSPDGRYAAYARAHSVALIGPSGRVVATKPVTSTPTGLSFDASDDVLVMTNNAIYLWKPLSRQPPLLIQMPSPPVDAALNRPSAELAAAGTDGKVRVWSAATGRLIKAFTPAGHNADSYYQPTPLRVAISPDGRVVVSGNADGTVDFWDVATGKRIADQAVSTWPVIELNPAGDGSDLLAVDWPQAGSGINPAGAAAVLDADTGRVVASYLSPSPVTAPVDPGAALSADGGFVFAGVLGLGPSAPAGVTAAYQVSGGQLMADLQGAAISPQAAYSESAVRPWSPDGRELLVGTAIYACDSCGPLVRLQAAAATRIAWSAPLAVGSDHPPAISPYG